MNDPTPPIDFTDLHKYPPHDNECRCGAYYESHSRFVGPPKLCVVTERPCPGCGKHDNLRSSRGRPHDFTL